MIVDAYSETWIAIRERANEIIEAARGRLELADQSQNESQYLRGKIAAMREVLDMAKPKAVKIDKIPEELRPRDRSGI